MCSPLTNNFVAHWRAFASAAAAATQPSPGAPAERKVLASAARGLACAVSKGGVAPVLEPYLARVVHALNHLVQPAGEGERATAAAASRGGGSSSASGSRSRGRDFGGLGRGAARAGMSPARTSAAASLADLRARVRLQAVGLLEAMAVKDSKSLYPHWALFFPPCGFGPSLGAGEEPGSVDGER